MSIRAARAMPPALLGAIAASAVVHASLLVMPALDLATRVMPNPLPALSVAIAPPAAATPRLAMETLPLLTTHAASPPVFALIEVPGERSDPHVALLPAPLAHGDPRVIIDAAAAVDSAPIAPLAERHVEAQQVMALARLGDFIERELNEFPREVEAPVRLAEPIVARYPEAAVAQRIEGDVVAWVVVDGQANVEEIQFIEGDDMFRAAVTEAIKAARFRPASDRGVGLRFPIALEFRFALDTARELTAAVAPR